MAVYGWWQWRGDKASDATSNIDVASSTNKSAITISRWSLQYHLLAWAAIAVLTVISGSLLAKNTTAALPYLDSFTTWGSVLTTWMVARKILENWLYWIVIDGVSIFLYIDRGLHLTSLLFVAYVIIVVFGYFSWRKRLAAPESRELAVRA